jgi:hypothetical protein
MRGIIASVRDSAGFSIVIDAVVVIINRGIDVFLRIDPGEATHFIVGPFGQIVFRVDPIEIRVGI